MLSVVSGAVLLGFQYALLALGVYISFRILNIPDLTVDGSFTFGIAVSAVLCASGHPFWVLRRPYSPALPQELSRDFYKQKQNSPDTCRNTHHEQSLHSQYNCYGCSQCIFDRQKEIL